MHHPARNFKQRAHALVERLPPDATWSDLAEHATVRQDIENNYLDDDTGRVAEEVLEEYEQMQTEMGGHSSRAQREGW